MYFNGTKCCLLVFCSLLSISLIAKDAKKNITKGTNTNQSVSGGRPIDHQYIPAPIVTSSGSCVGDPIFLYVNPDTAGAITILYSWTGPAGFTSTLQNPTIPGATVGNAGYYYITDSVVGIGSRKDSIYVSISPNTPASISISVSPNDTLCLGTNVTFTATTLTGGASPTYQWVNGTTPVVGAVSSTWSTPSLTDGNMIYCILYSSLVCPFPRPNNSNVIRMNMLNSTPIVYIAASAGPSITADSPVTFTSITYNAGAGAIYQWTLNRTNVAGATNSIFTIAHVTTFDTVALIVTSVMACATPDFGKSNTIIVHAHTAGVASVTTSFENLALFPNPNNGSFTLTGDLQNSSSVSIDILNPLGQVMYSDKIIAPGARLTKAIDLNNVPTGVYLLHLYQEGESKMLRFSVRH